MDRELERLVKERAGGRCEYCRLSQAELDLPFEVDHIIAEHHQGKTQEDNLCFACLSCNRYKGPNIAGVDHKSGRIVPLFNPRRQQWSRHFRWRGAALVGKTASGRATVVALKMNLQHRLDLRQGLMEEGTFPPGTR